MRGECELHFTLCRTSGGACVCELENDDHNDDNDHDDDDDDVDNNDDDDDEGVRECVGQVALPVKVSFPASTPHFGAAACIAAWTSSSSS